MNKSVQKLYQKKMNILIDACSLYLPNDVQFTKPKSGFYLTIFLPSHIQVEQLIDRLQEKCIYVDNASRMYLGENKQNAIRLSISQVDETKIHQGFQQLTALIMELEEKRAYNSITFKSYHSS